MKQAPTILSSDSYKNLMQACVESECPSLGSWRMIGMRLLLIIILIESSTTISVVASKIAVLDIAEQDHQVPREYKNKVSASSRT